MQKNVRSSHYHCQDPCISTQIEFHTKIYMWSYRHRPNLPLVRTLCDGNLLWAWYALQVIFDLTISDQNYFWLKKFKAIVRTFLDSKSSPVRLKQYFIALPIDLISVQCLWWSFFVTINGSCGLLTVCLIGPKDPCDFQKIISCHLLFFGLIYQSSCLL